MSQFVTMNLIKNVKVTHLLSVAKFSAIRIKFNGIEVLNFVLKSEISSTCVNKDVAQFE